MGSTVISTNKWRLQVKLIRGFPKIIAIIALQLLCVQAVTKGESLDQNEAQREKLLDSQTSHARYVHNYNTSTTSSGSLSRSDSQSLVLDDYDNSYNSNSIESSSGKPVESDEKQSGSSFPHLNHLLDQFAHHKPLRHGKQNVSSICLAFAKTFARAASNYTECFIVNSRPLQICTKCVEEYLKVNQAYYDLERMTDHPMHQGRHTTSDCKDWILNADRIMAVQQTKAFFDQLWKRSQCSNCFSKIEWKGNITYEVSSYFTKFRTLANDAVQCFSNFSSDLLFLAGSSIEEPHQSDACQDCKSSYNVLNKYYLQLDSKYGDDLCMDIVDTMNYTRIVWANNFNCTGNARQDSITVTITCLFFVLPAVFYIASHIHYQRIEKKIVKQNRMFRSRHGSVRGAHLTSPSPAPSAVPMLVHSTNGPINS